MSFMKIVLSYYATLSLDVQINDFKQIKFSSKMYLSMFFFYFGLELGPDRYLFANTGLLQIYQCIGCIGEFVLWQPVI